MMHFFFRFYYISNGKIAPTNLINYKRNGKKRCSVLNLKGRKLISVKCQNSKKMPLCEISKISYSALPNFKKGMTNKRP